MKNIFICFFIISSAFVCVPGVRAWTDAVEGVMMPAARGGAGISDEEVENAMGASADNEAEEPQALIDWE